METATGAPKAPESVGAAAAPVATPATKTPATPAQQTEANPWEHIDEYSPDPSISGPNAVETPATTQDPSQQPSAQTEVSPAGALNADTTSAQTTDGQPPPKANAPGPIPYERFKEVNDKVAALEKMANFYQASYNDLIAQTQAPASPAQAQPGATAPKTTGTEDQNAAPAADAGKLPQGIKGPGEWDTQEEMAAYHDHVATTKAQTMARTEIERTIAPAMQTINKWVGALEDMVVRSVHPDFDEVTKPVLAELFVTDHEGQVWTDPQGNPKIKNPALLNWIRQSPSPRKALYDYALSKQAPEKITEAVQNTTKQLLTALDTRPKGPLQPRQAAGDNKAVSLDWDTPPATADRILSERGVF